MIEKIINNNSHSNTTCNHGNDSYIAAKTATNE